MLLQRLTQSCCERLTQAVNPMLEQPINVLGHVFKDVVPGRSQAECAPPQKRILQRTHR